MPSNRSPNYAPIAFNFVVVSVSVSSEVSARAAGVGPFAGIFVRTATSLTVVSQTGNSISLDAVAANATIWLSGSFVSVISTATAVYALS